ncbi:FadR/GntR family transcriptional regulator [Sediminispirochaeta smaragdinae]|uniref:GntR domain protein n=1 Tax=Sediminispirochaeta smaragdinae (strain DSM 11293 / JCM 15392 / SEBR 4228) TaxID=573413 RepID=E1RC46_SEDSS|nr:FadR/GntR family transcriptional regulator [Sediminispirochaeta smaragdinae]ADK79926.1 GntR domain protein [Sediminispirochaeta smaragdinae DSM 11293]
MRKIDKISITDKVVEELSTLVKSGEYQAGDKLPTEEALRNTLGVGRSTVRESLRILQTLGLVEIRPGRGAFVLDNSNYTNKMVHDWFSENKTQVEDLMDVRLAIETMAITLAIKKGKPEQIAKIRAIHESFKDSIDKGNNIELARLDDAFHAAIMEATNNPYLVRMGFLVSESLIEYRKRSFAVSENIVHALAPHEEILTHIIRKEEQAAVKAMQSHIACSLEDMMNLINGGEQ